MITAVAQTLADLLANGSPLLSAVQIDLSHPTKRLDVRPALSLYLYDLRQSTQGNELGEQNLKQNSSRVFWFDLSFVIIPWDWTDLGQQRLLSETLQLLLSHPKIREDDLVPVLKGHGDLPLKIVTGSRDVAALWSALGIPLEPALYITIKTPFPVVGHSSICLDKNLKA